ncbi:MAG TPA: Hpt domain-containing protein [Rhodothermales bacterium]|nr:Hpt domain-containing protein [Rhodothermales bacterium]
MSSALPATAAGIVNLAYLEASSFGQAEFMQQAIDLLLAQLPDLLVQLDRAKKASDPAGMRMTAHKIKSSVAMLGMESTRDLLQMLESGSSSGIDDFERSVHKINEMCALAIAELRMERGRYS